MKSLLATLLLLGSMSSFAQQSEYRDHWLVTKSPIIEAQDIDILGKKVINIKTKDEVFLNCTSRVNGDCESATVAIKVNGEVRNMGIHGQEISLFDFEKIKTSMERNLRVHSIGVVEEPQIDMAGDPMWFTKADVFMIAYRPKNPLWYALAPLAVAVDIAKLPLDAAYWTIKGVAHLVNEITQSIRYARYTKSLKALVGNTKTNVKINDRKFAHFVEIAHELSLK